MVELKRLTHLSPLLAAFAGSDQHVESFRLSPSCNGLVRCSTLFASIDDGVVLPRLSHPIDRRSSIAVGSMLFPVTSLLPAYANTDLTIPSWKLTGDVDFPILALNTAGLSSDETVKAVQLARNEGITHIDFHPGDERDGVARYLSQNKGSRDSYFLNTKIRKAPPGTSPKDAAELARNQLENDLRVLKVDYVDMLMLRDSPDPEVIQSQWAFMEEALASGKTKSVGVVNYCQKALESVLQTAKIVPAVNYIMVHVGMGKNVHGLRTFSEDRGIRIFAYGQTGEPEPAPEILRNHILQRIGKAHGGKSPEEVALRWVLQNNIAASIRPSSSFGRCSGEECALGIAKQVGTLGWTLTDKEMTELDALNSPDDNPTLFSSAGCPGAFGL